MFAKMLATLLPSLVDKKPSPNLDYFESTRGSSETPARTSAPTVTANSASARLQPAKKQPTVQELFYHYLFGEAPESESQDPLSCYLEQQITPLLINPEQLLTHLPVMPKSVSLVIDRLSDPDFDINQLLTVIQQEPVLAADLIKLANSARYRRGDREICDLKTAFMTMGANGLTEGVLQSYISRFTPKPTIYYKRFGENIWRHALQTAESSARLCQGTPHSAGMAYFAGLIKNIGIMIIFQLMLDAFAHVDPAATPGSDTFKNMLIRYTSALTLALAEYWKLPKPVVDALNPQNAENPGSLAELINDAQRLSKLELLIEANAIDKQNAQLQAKQTLVLENSKNYLKKVLKIQDVTAN